MSLQVWLPLNGDLRNQGLSTLSFNNISDTNTTINNSGKIGKCYSNDSHTAGGLISDGVIELGQQQSMFCWFKFTDLHSGASLGGSLISQHRTATFTGMGITIRYVSSTTGYLSVSTGDGSSRTYNTYYGTTLLQANTWYHGGYTYDGSTIKIYVNGVCEKTQPFSGMSVPADYISCFCWNLTGTSGNTIQANYRFQGSLNDIRIYNHCLSESEVKRLAQGLIVHYPLNRQGLGQENLWRNSSCQENLDGMIQSTVKFNITTKDGFKCAHISGTKGSNATGYLAIPDAMLPEANAWYTISADMRIDNYSAGTTNPYVGLYFGGDYLNTDNTGGWYGGSSYSGDGKADAQTFVNTYNNKGWHRVSCTVQYLHGGTEYKKGAFRLGYVYARDFTGDLYVKNIKLEKGKIATPWCEGPSIINTDLTAATTVAGVTYTPGIYSNITVSGTSTGTTGCMLQTLRVVQPGIYTVHCYGNLSSDGVRFIPYKESNGTKTYYDMTTPGSKTIYVAPGDTYGYYLRTNGNNVLVNTVVWAFHNFEVLEEYDISGFGNNGTRTGTFTWSSDTPKYNVSTQFSNSRIQCSGNFLESLTTATLSAWVKLNSYHSERCMVIFANGRYLTVNSSGQVSGYSYGKSPAGYHNGTKVIPLNTWTHIAVVWDTSNLYIYVNGVLDKTIACTGSFTTSGGYASIGQESNGARAVIGNISDARIYATALSADDVKSLYQNCATIGPDGTIYGQLRS